MCHDTELKRRGGGLQLQDLLEGAMPERLGQGAGKPETETGYPKGLKIQKRRFTGKGSISLPK